MNDIGIGAVGAAIIAGLISLLGLIIGKEQKVSEFRQAWIDELRKCLVAYLVNINAIADALRVAKANGEQPTGIDQNYKLLNEANHGIKLRVNDREEPSLELLQSMEEFETLAQKNSDLTPENIRQAEEKFLSASKALLKFEWRRVKRGEKTYFWTKYIVIALITVMLMIFAYLWYHRDPKPEIKPNSAAESSVITTVLCSGAEPRSVGLPQGQTVNSTENAAHLPTDHGTSSTTIVCDPQSSKPQQQDTDAAAD